MSDDARKMPSLPLIAIAIVIMAVAVTALANLANAVDRGRQKRTMGDMRTLATAMETYSIDNNRYLITRGDVPAGDIAASLEPTYVKLMPREDGWGEPLYVASTAKEYTIVSLGKDRLSNAENPQYVHPNGGTTSFSNDIIFSTGSFVQFPDGTMR